MTVETTLAKVDADLRAGRIPVARQRLRSLVGRYPADLTVRRRLAEVYRLYGEPVEAGRWAYLEEERDEAETAAFEGRYADPRRRMRALAWRTSERTASTETARARLAELRAAASAEEGRPVQWGQVSDPYRPNASDDDSGPWFCLGIGLVGLLLGAFAVLGMVTFAGWWF
ncbi:DUF6584 family protein [Kitasatospora sp. NPDC056076]|uniref:DUF6584 family protein n=1 Tax=unclassified Kitasatospora TaxID=2633591 RepID=UPI0035E1779E